MQGYVNQEGTTITPEQMAQIEQRHDTKAALLAEMRADREAAYGQKHSHVGVEIGRDLGELALISPTYHNLAAMANYCAMAGKDQAGRTLASLANGVMRAAVEMYGKDIEPRILNHEAILLEQARQGLGLAPKPTDDQSSEDEPNAHMLVGSDAGFIRDADGQVIAQARTLEVLDPEGLPASDYPGLMGVTSQTLHDPDHDLATMIRQGGLSGNDIDDDQGSEDEPLNVTEVPAVSPEPVETPQRKAARLRREAKRLAEQADVEQEAGTPGAETSAS